MPVFPSEPRPCAPHPASYVMTLAATALLASCAIGGAEPPELSSTASAMTVEVAVAAQQSDTDYFFLVSTDDTPGLSYTWWLVFPGGAVQVVATGVAGFDLSIGVNQLPPGTYQFEVTGTVTDPDGFVIDTFLGISAPITLPLVAATPDVGVIPDAAACPPSVQTVRIGMDNEDSRPASSVTGWVGGTVLDGNRNTNFVFCRVPGDRLASLAAASSNTSNYAVLRLGAQCPPGSVPFSRFFDNEDGQNLNWWSGNIAPNTNLGNTRLDFCLFAGGGTPAPLPDLGFSYGVFAAPQFAFAASHGSISTDDEDSNNINSYTVDPAWQAAAQAIIVPGGNTTLNTARIPRCGDHLCTNGETASSCPADCDVCGNGICRANETVTSCPRDCAVCGDGICSPNENCPQDCTSGCPFGPDSVARCPA